MVSALDSGSSGLGSIPGWGHCVVFLGETLYSLSASLHPARSINIVLRSRARHFTLTEPLSTQEYKWVPANC